MAVQNGETSCMDEEYVLHYRLTQNHELMKVINELKEKLTVGPIVSEGSCCICFEKLAHRPTERWACGHDKICLPCSQEWQARSPGAALCPICRKRKPINDREFPSLSRK